MKKLLSIIAALMLTAGAASCSGQKTGSAPVSSQETTAETATTLQDDTSVTEAAATSTAAVTTVTTAAQAVTQPDPLGGGEFEYNADGAVVFEKPSADTDDRILIAAGQALYESACRTEWNFTVDCPFRVDDSSIIENNFGWQFCKITEDGIKTYDDVLAAYNKVFSGRYPNSSLSSLYLEKNGAVYAHCGRRGSDIFYSASKVTGIKSKSDDEIVFTVENYYDGDDFGGGPYTETEDFSAVIEDGNVWKAGIFTLPY